jgi:hypothetical protein
MGATGGVQLLLVEELREAGSYEMAHHCGSAYVRSLPLFHDKRGYTAQHCGTKRQPGNFGKGTQGKFRRHIPREFCRQFSTEKG